MKEEVQGHHWLHSKFKASLDCTRLKHKEKGKKGKREKTDDWSGRGEERKKGGKERRDGGRGRERMRKRDRERQRLRDTETQRNTDRVSVQETIGLPVAGCPGYANP